MEKNAREDETASHGKEKQLKSTKDLKQPGLQLGQLARGGPSPEKRELAWGLVALPGALHS